MAINKKITLMRDNGTLKNYIYIIYNFSQFNAPSTHFSTYILYYIISPKNLDYIDKSTFKVIA